MHLVDRDEIVCLSVVQKANPFSVAAVVSSAHSKYTVCRSAPGFEARRLENSAINGRHFLSRHLRAS